MTSIIEVHGPATFPAPARLTTDKKVNLIYGLNGSGKTTMCRFLRSPALPEFSKCTLELPRDVAVYVYNDDFVRENFHESENLKGIFSLSKENKDAELRIEQARNERTKALVAKQRIEDRQAQRREELVRARQLAEDAAWTIRTKHSGGDRVLEYCLDGLKGKKETLLNHLLGVARPSEPPTYDSEKLKAEALALSGSEARSEVQIPRLAFDATPIEIDPVFETPIVGSKQNAVSELIGKLGSSDWVREGLKYIPDSPPDANAQCPFCQASTISAALAKQLREFFDESYRTAVDRVVSSETTYRDFLGQLPRREDVEAHPFSTEKLSLLLEQLRGLMESNLQKIKFKGQSPSLEVLLASSSALVSEANNQIDEINSSIALHNDKLNNKTSALAEIKSRFWTLMRWEQDQVIARLLADQNQIQGFLSDLAKDLEPITEAISKMDREIAEAQKATVNTDEAVSNINTALLNLGIDDFSIEKHNESLYRIQRKSEGSSKFTTLSEGEKMIITLLYFCELCKGRRSATDTTEEKVVVFDDPISSLSHIYIFNVGQLIRSEFFFSNIATQVFVFTHSLYFFYELADNKSERREKNQALFRMTKSKGQSQIVPMKYDEIQNDYQAYWQIVNDRTHHPALIANCMRNIVDYFFGFVGKLDFNNVFQQPALRENRLQAFSRFMNRESHSFGQNIYDLKEFDHDAFRDGLRLVFENSGYGEHYRKMSNI